MAHNNLEQRWTFQYEEVAKSLVLELFEESQDDDSLSQKKLVETLEVHDSLSIKVILHNSAEYILKLRNFAAEDVCSATLLEFTTQPPQEFIKEARSYPGNRLNDSQDLLLTMPDISDIAASDNTLHTTYNDNNSTLFQNKNPERFLVGRYEVPFKCLIEPGVDFQVRPVNNKRVEELKKSLSSSGCMLSSQLTVLIPNLQTVEEFVLADLATYTYIVLDGNHRLHAMTKIRRESPDWFTAVDCRIYVGLTTKHALSLGYIRNNEAASVFKMSDYDTACLIRRIFGEQPLQSTQGKKDNKLEDVYHSLNITQRKDRIHIQPLRFVAGLPQPMWDIVKEAMCSGKAKATTFNPLRTLSEEDKLDTLQKFRETEFSKCFSIRDQAAMKKTANSKKPVEPIVVTVDKCISVGKGKGPKIVSSSVSLFGTTLSMGEFEKALKASVQMVIASRLNIENNNNSLFQNPPVSEDSTAFKTSTPKTKKRRAGSHDNKVPEAEQDTEKHKRPRRSSNRKSTADVYNFSSEGESENELEEINKYNIQKCPLAVSKQDAVAFYVPKSAKPSEKTSPWIGIVTDVNIDKDIISFDWCVKDEGDSWTCGMGDPKEGKTQIVKVAAKFTWEGNGDLPRLLEKHLMKICFKR